MAKKNLDFKIGYSNQKQTVSEVNYHSQGISVPYVNLLAWLDKLILIKT